MENIEDFRSMWQDLNKRISHLEKENEDLVRNIMKTKYKSTQEKLEKKYGRFIMIECIMIVFMSLYLIYNPLINERYRFITLVYWDVFFVMEVLLDFYLHYQIKEIDIYNSTVKDVSKRAAANWKLHKIGIIVGFPMAFGAILLFALAVNANRFTILGMICGGVIGLIIGVNQLLKFKNYYNLLQADD